MIRNLFCLSDEHRERTKVYLPTASMQWRSFLREAVWLRFWTLILLIIAIDDDRAAFSQESKPTREPAASTLSSLHIHNYGYHDTGCLQWSDGCRACVRTGTSAFD